MRSLGTRYADRGEAVSVARKAQEQTSFRRLGYKCGVSKDDDGWYATIKIHDIIIGEVDGALIK